MLRLEADRQILIEHRIVAQPEKLVGDLVRWEYNPSNFLGFEQLAAICILLRQFRVLRIGSKQGSVSKWRTAEHLTG